MVVVVPVAGGICIFFGQHPFRVIRGRMGYIDFSGFSAHA
jgi:hypothetical protein